MSPVEQDLWGVFRSNPCEETFSPLYERTKTLVYTICYRVLRNREDAADAFQSVYCRLLALARNHETAPDAADVDQLVGRFAVREATNLRRRRRRHVQREVAMEHPPESAGSNRSPDQIAANGELRDKIEALVSILPEKFRLPLLLHYFDGMTQIEIARSLDVPEGTIRSRIARGLKKLRPLMHRAGLGDATLTLSAILAGAHLLEPPAALGASAVFAQANALLVSGGAAGVLTAGGVAGTGVGTGVMIKSLGGAILMKSKIAIVGAVLVALILVIRQLDKSNEPPTFEKPGSALQTDADGERKSTQRTVVPTPPIDAEDFDAIAAEFADSETPTWAVEIQPIERGSYRYWFYVDGVRIADPLGTQSDPWRKESVFTWPPAAGEATATVPRVLSSDRALFIYEGAIERSALFIAPFRGGWWGIDEFQPLNDAARENLRRILADPTVGGLKGVVVDTRRQPVAGARVRLLTIGEDEEVHVQTVECDEQGRFRALRLPRTVTLGIGRAMGFAESEPFLVVVSSIDATPEQEIILKPTAMIGGRVTDEAGMPVADAEVTARLLRASDRRTDTVAHTNAGGRYFFGSLYPGQYEFFADAAGLCPAVKGGIRISDEALRREPDVNFVLERGGQLRGRVVRRPDSPDGDATPVEGADVRLYGNLSGPAGAGAGQHGLELHTLSRANGEFVFEHVNFGLEYQCDAQLGGNLSEERIQIVFGEGKAPPEVVLHFPPEGSLAGRVVDTDGAPIGGAEVQVRTVTLAPFPGQETERSTRWYGMTPDLKATTDGHGRFVLDELAKGARCEVDVRAEGFAPVRRGNLIAGSPTEVEIVLTGANTVSGRVVEEGSESPLSGLLVQAFGGPEGYRSGPLDFPKTTTGKDGSFAFLELPAGPYFLSAKGIADGKAFIALPEEPIKIGDGKAVDNLVLRARACATIRGAVLMRETHEPVEGAFVMLETEVPGMMPNVARTGPDGTFVLSQVTPGGGTIRAQCRGYASEAKLAVDAQPGEIVENVELLLDKGGVISGIVADADGNPVPNVILYLEGSDDRREFSDLDGRFQYSGVNLKTAAEQEYRVRTHPFLERDYYGRSEPVQLTSEKPDAEVIVRVSPGGSISGRVTDSAGEPLAGVWITSYPFPREYTNARTDEAGRYRIGALGPGKYTVTAWHDEFQDPDPNQVNLAENENREDVDFQLEASEDESQWFVRGLLLDLRGRPLGGWAVFAEPELEQGPKPFSEPVYHPNTTTGHDGTFEIGGLQEVRYTVRFAEGGRDRSGHNQGYQTQGVRTFEGEAPGTVREQVFVVARGAVVRGRVVFDDSGEPVPQFQVVVQYKWDKAWRVPSDDSPGVSDGLCICLGHHEVENVEKSDNGAFRVEGLPIGTFNIRVVGNDVNMLWLEDVVPDESLAVDLGEVKVQRGHRIRMCLVNGRTGEPWQYSWTGAQPGGGLAIQGRRADGSPIHDLIYSAPRSNGEVTVGGAPASLVRLNITTNRFLPKTLSNIEIRPDGETDLGDVALDPGGTVTGRFVDAASGNPCSSDLHPGIVGIRRTGAGAEHLYLEQDDRRRVVGENGRFTVHRVPDDIERLVFTFQAIGSVYLDRTVEPVRMPGSGTCDLGDVLLERGQIVRGRIKGPEDEDVWGVYIVIQPSDHPSTARVVETKDGEFVIPGLPAGPAVLNAAASRSAYGNAWIESEDGKAVLKDFPITILPAGETRIKLQFPAAQPTGK